MKKLLLIPIIAIFLSACSPQTPTADKNSTIISQNFAYSPQEVRVKAGQTVTFTNKDLVGHSVTSENGSSFDTGVIDSNQTITFTAPNTPGSYPFYCTVHPNMKGMLVVE